MLEPFLIALRESAQCALVLALLTGYLKGGQGAVPYRFLLAGAFFAFITGFPLGYVPQVSARLLDNEVWSFWRFVFEAVLFYIGIAVIIIRPVPSSFVASAGLFLLGFFIVFFEARAVGFLVQDIGAMREARLGSLSLCMAGALSGFLPFFLLRKYILKIPLRDAFVLPSLLMFVGALLFVFGGVAELEKESVMISLQRGLLGFFSEGMKHLQSVLLIEEHPFMKVPFAEFGRFLGGDRIAMSAAILFLMTPPLFVLIHLLAKPDPVVSPFQAGARRRYKIAFFRKELTYHAAPVLTSFVLLVVMLHAVNVSFNPMYEPVPVPVREAENGGVLRIPLSDKTGDLSDRKLRKYVYYYGNKQIVLLAILKPDGTVGIALDECEVCRPADWNKDARGYAQRGENLVCKYCMTPIAIPTVNNPGGCNPIPVAFRVEDKEIIISLSDLTDTFNKVQALEKKGTHL